MTVRFLLVMAALLGGVCSLPAQTIDQGEALLRPGDVLRIAVWRKPEYSGEFAIDAAGRIAHPIFHELEVRDLSLARVNDLVRELLRNVEGDTPFVIEPLVQVGVGGEVRQPDL